ncbi:MAG: site-specific integrase, partial [Nostoc sp.]
MKINRHGRAKVLTQQEIQLIFSDGLDNNRDRALFGVCLYT